MLSEVDRAVESADARPNNAERVKCCRVVPSRRDAENGELTPTLKLGRRFVRERCAETLDELYS